ncbi:MAG: T9SS type A sorting domain-containing protein [Bacteroidia bacterium]
MKTKTTLLSIAAVLSLGLLKGQDLVPGINYSYNPPGANGIITSIAVDACENDGVAVSSFNVSMYLYDMSTSNYWIIDSYAVNSMNGSSCVSITNWDIDINNTPGIPAGTYRLGIWVDSGSDISESDENNNVGLLSGNINYSPSGSTGIASVSPAKFNLDNVFPNPAADKVKFSYALTEETTVNIRLVDISGKEVKVLLNQKQEKGNYSPEFVLSDLDAGIYFYRFSAGTAQVTKKIVITR